MIAILRISIVSALMAGVGLYTGMLVMVAAAVESTADMLALFATHIGLKISQKSADKGFRYGYYKIETFAALIVSLIILYLGSKILVESFSRVSEPVFSSNIWLNIIVLLFAMTQSRYLAKRLINSGKRINSIALVACGKDKQIDFYVRITVLIGLTANYFKIPYVEGLIGMGIAALTIKVGLEIAKESSFFLLDYFDDKKMINKIIRTIKKHSVIVKGVHDIRMRRAGTVIFGEAILDILPNSESGEIRNELNKLKEEIYKVDKYIKTFSLYINIPHPSKIRVAVPVKSNKGLNSEIALSFNETKAYIFVDIKDKKIVDHYSKTFKFPPTEFIEIVKFLDKEKVDIVINNNMHSLLSYNIRHLKHMRVYPHFQNVNNVIKTIKLLIIDI